MMIRNRITVLLKQHRNFANLAKPFAAQLLGKYMREIDIKAQWLKSWTTTRDSNFSSKLHNILNEQFNPERPDAVQCTDITHIWTQDGFIYLNCVMDLFARKIIAWTLSDTMEVSSELRNRFKFCVNYKKLI